VELRCHRNRGRGGSVAADHARSSTTRVAQGARLPPRDGTSWSSATAGARALVRQREEANRGGPCSLPGVPGRPPLLHPSRWVGMAGAGRCRDGRRRMDRGAEGRERGRLAEGERWGGKRE
jgi:hypothetical protein